jgi:hypothetical protein
VKLGFLVIGPSDWLRRPWNRYLAIQIARNNTGTDMGGARIRVGMQRRTGRVPSLNCGLGIGDCSCIRTRLVRQLYVHTLSMQGKMEMGRNLRVHCFRSQRTPGGSTGSIMWSSDGSSQTFWDGSPTPGATGDSFDMSSRHERAGRRGALLLASKHVSSNTLIDTSPHTGKFR